MEDEFMNKFSKNLIMDSTREKFAKETFKILLNLKNKIYENHTGYQRLLLGSKGVGKTVFLEEIQKIAKGLFEDNLITIYHEYLSTDKIIKPSCLIANVLKNETLKEDIRLCEKELKNKKKFVFIVLDEIQNLYLKNDNGKQVINQLSEIGGSREGCICCIVTGSSYHLRQLCFAKLPNNIKEKYPNYISLDLNSTKYSSRWIYPFLDIEDFERLTEFTYNKSKKENEVDEKNQLALLYLKTGGNPRLLEKIVLNGESKFDLMKNFQNKSDRIKSKILESVFHCTSVFIDKTCISTIEDLLDEPSISTFIKWTKLFKYSCFLEKFNQDNTDENLSEELLPLIYDLSDSGHLRFIDNQFNQLIGLGSPLIYLQLANKNSKSVLTMDEIFALKNPSGPYSDIAENVVLSILAQNSHIFNISGLKMTYKNLEKTILKENYTNIKTYADEIYVFHNLDTITNKLFKVCYMSATNQMVKDALEIDGLLLQSNANNLIAHRIQIQLGPVTPSNRTILVETKNQKTTIATTTTAKLNFFLSRLLQQQRQN